MHALGCLHTLYLAMPYRYHVTSTMCLDEVDRVIVCRLDGQVSEHQMKSQASADYYR